MIKAIVYTSNTGTTAEYAALLGDSTGLPVYSLADAKQQLSAGSEIIYLGWVCASAVKGYKAAAKRFNVRALCGVCMGGTGTQLDELRSRNSVSDSLPLFTMQGGFNINKLHGVYKFMMSFMGKTLGKGLAEKKDRTADDDAMLEMLLHGKSFVGPDNMKAVLDWYSAVAEK